MAKEKRIALVTGANKGIGFEVARDLARKGFHVFLGARNEEAGKAAAQKLKREAEEEHSGENSRRGAVTVVKINVLQAGQHQTLANLYRREEVIYPTEGGEKRRRYRSGASRMRLTGGGSLEKRTSVVLP